MRACLAILSALLVMGGAVRGEEDAAEELASFARQEVVPADATAVEILELCRAMVPAEVVIGGRVVRRSRHGRTIASYGYVLSRHGGKTDLELKDDKGEVVAVERSGRIADTDVTWSDLTMDFLWWKDVTFDAKAESESMSGILCKVLLLKEGNRAYRAWIDRRTGAMLQAAELRLADGEWKTVREVFCTSLRKFGERWAPRNIEVGPPGAKYRTKITVESVEDVK